MSVAIAPAIPLSPTKPDSNRRLRVGVIVDSLVLPMWAIHALEEIEGAEFADLVLILRMGRRAENSPSPHSLDAVLLRLWLSVDERMFGRRCARPDAFRLASFVPCRSHPKIVDWPCQATTFSSPQAVVDETRTAGLDVLLQFGSAVPPMQVLELSRFGVWSFANSNRATADLFWTIYEQDPVIGNEPQVLSSDPNQSGMPCSYLAADPLSLFRNYSKLCWKRSDTLLRCLSELHRGGRRSVQEYFHKQYSPPERSPWSSETLRLMLRVFARTIREELRKRFTRERWFVAFRKILKAEEIAGRTSLRVLWPPDGRFYADPFVWEREGKVYIFFEDYSYERRKAVISFVEVDDDGACSEPQLALEEDCHLAYPFLFEWNGEMYLLPETKNKRNIQVYRATAFPRGWQLAHVLLRDVAAADSTLFRHDGKFWLFTSGLGTADPWFDADSELFLFSSDSLQGPWVAHPRNPVVADVRRSRCAGQLFFLGNQLIRPAQDCSRCYGHAVVLNRIELLSEKEYREVPIGRISPEWMAGNRGTHTFNHSAHYEVLDGRTLIGRYPPRHRRGVLQTLAATTQLLKQF